MNRQNNGYNMKMSSKYEQSGTGPSFLPHQGFLLHVLYPGVQTWTCVAPDVAPVGGLTSISFQKTFTLFF